MQFLLRFTILQDQNISLANFEVGLEWRQQAFCLEDIADSHRSTKNKLQFFRSQIGLPVKDKACPPLKDASLSFSNIIFKSFILNSKLCCQK